MSVKLHKSVYACYLAFLLMAGAGLIVRLGGSASGPAIEDGCWRASRSWSR